MATLFIVRRLLNNFNAYRIAVGLNRINQFSTTKWREGNKNKNSTPVKYSLTHASKLLIENSINMKRQEDVFWFEPLVIIACLAIFLIHFCILHEEHDIDEILKGNPEYLPPSAKLIDLQLKLQYLEKCNLPTEAMKRKIEEVKKELQ